jgi:hypothetical protein
MQLLGNKLTVVVEDVVVNVREYVAVSVPYMVVVVPVCGRISLDQVKADLNVLQ